MMPPRKALPVVGAGGVEAGELRGGGHVAEGFEHGDEIDEGEGNEERRAEREVSGGGVQGTGAARCRRRGPGAGARPAGPQTT